MLPVNCTESTLHNILSCWGTWDIKSYEDLDLDIYDGKENNSFKCDLNIVLSLLYIILYNTEINVFFVCEHLISGYYQSCSPVINLVKTFTQTEFWS